MEYPKVEIHLVDFSESRYVEKGKVWLAATLQFHIKKQECEVFDLPLCAIDITARPFVINNYEDFIEHAYRMNNVDMDYPIILSWNGYIADGWHRVAKAIIEGKTTIKAYRLKYEPPYDYLEEKES